MRIRNPLIATVSVLVLVVGLLVVSATASRPEARRRPDRTITGTNGDDRLRGTSGPDVICARGGSDHVRGKGGDDVILLGPGRDVVSAGGGDDRVFGGSGRDYTSGGRGDDRVFLGRGGDFAGNELFGADRLYGGLGVDCVSARDGKGNDRLFGGPGHDWAGADTGDIVRSAEIGPVECGEVPTPVPRDS